MDNQPPFVSDFKTIGTLSMCIQFTLGAIYTDRPYFVRKSEPVIGLQDKFTVHK